MSEKIDRRWRINSRAVLEVLYEGRWETAGTRWTYPDNGHNQRFAEAVADACGDIDALTSERDEAVRVAGTLRALVDDALDELGQCELTQYSNWCIKHSSRMPCRVKAIREALDSLIATTGGSSEPQKGITE